VKYCYFSSPLGRLFLAGDQDGLKYLKFPTELNPESEAKFTEEDNQNFTDVQSQLTDYFAGKLKQFKLKLAPHGTSFQLQVLEELSKIPYGKTISYGELASHIGRAKASRAVGAANGRNPLPIIIPCHRVIGADGSLTGFAGGLRIKSTLLELEKKYR
jgi:methylated-DNA-[protein]-cysteine S-methyltransferase